MPYLYMPPEEEIPEPPPVEPGQYAAPAPAPAAAPLVPAGTAPPPSRRSSIRRQVSRTTPGEHRNMPWGTESKPPLRLRRSPNPRRPPPRWVGAITDRARPAPRTLLGQHRHQRRRRIRRTPRPGAALTRQPPPRSRHPRQGSALPPPPGRHPPRPTRHRSAPGPACRIARASSLTAPITCKPAKSAPLSALRIGGLGRRSNTRRSSGRRCPPTLSRCRTQARGTGHRPRPLRTRPHGTPLSMA
jgi:hypothetical protein